jgi:hypothetical protein
MYISVADGLHLPTFITNDFELFLGKGCNFVGSHAAIGDFHGRPAACGDWFFIIIGGDGSAIITIF